MKQNSFRFASLVNIKNFYTALCKRVRTKGFVESRALRGSQQNLWFYLSGKRCIFSATVCATGIR